MYSGTTFRRGSGKIVGVHQKVDRIARRNLNNFIKKSLKFPGIRNILHFEGKNGPDGLKFKKSKQDNPWHFIDPSNPDDRALILIMDDHIFNLAEALKAKNSVRAAFEAAWLAHSITDGLTPAHHYALDEKIRELWGKSHNELISLRDKSIIRGKNRRDTISKNWQYWGSGGIFTAHLMYEMGVASSVAAGRVEPAEISETDIKRLSDGGFEVLFLESARKINNLNIYDSFNKSGWTVELATETKEVLLPEIIKSITLAWYQAAILSKGTKA
jgi:hypothetical protein